MGNETSQPQDDISRDMHDVVRRPNNSSVWACDVFGMFLSPPSVHMIFLRGQARERADIVGAAQDARVFFCGVKNVSFLFKSKLAFPLTK